MNQVRILWMMIVLSLAGMGTWVWKMNQKREYAEAALERSELSKRAAIEQKDHEKQEALASQNEEHQRALQAMNDDFEKKLDAFRDGERKRASAAFEQFGDILDGNKKTVDYINALEDKVKAGQALTKAETEKLSVIATGLSYLQKQYQKPFQDFNELETYLTKRATANVETPDMKNAFWKRMFSREFREQEREFYRTEGERRGFQDASAKFSTAYSAAQKQMASVNADFDKALQGLHHYVSENKKDPEDLSQFFDEARRAMSTHQKLLEFEPEVNKQPVEGPKP